MAREDRKRGTPQHPHAPTLELIVTSAHILVGGGGGRAGAPGAGKAGWRLMWADSRDQGKLEEQMANC